MPRRRRFRSSTAAAPARPAPTGPRSIFNAELMTGFAKSAGVAMPISRMTIGALQDMGYTVNYSAADAYALPGGPQTSTITGDGGNNTLNGTNSADTIFGLGGNDTLSGFGGNDTLDGGTGNDFIDGGSGRRYRRVLRQSCELHAAGSRRLRIVISGPDGSDTLVATSSTCALPTARSMLPTAARCLTRSTTTAPISTSSMPASARSRTTMRSAGAKAATPMRILDSSWYLAVNPDVRASGINPLQHYEQTGWREGRDPGPNFDVQLYLKNNPDVAAAGIDPLLHFLQFGKAEGRVASPGDRHGVVAASTHSTTSPTNPDVAAAGVDPLTISTPSAGARDATRTPCSTPRAISRTTPTCAAPASTRSALRAFRLARGARSRRRASTRCTICRPTPTSPRPHVNPLDHYLNNGIYEGRLPFADGLLPRRAGSGSRCATVGFGSLILSEPLALGSGLYAARWPTNRSGRPSPSRK